jgi:hypothetical protein
VLIPNNTIVTADQDLYVITHFHFDCNQSFHLQPQWTIYQCTANGSCLSLAIPHADHRIITTSIDLFVPAGTLPIGVFQLQLQLHLSIRGVLNQTWQETVHAHIIDAGIIPYLLPFGVSSITHGRHQSLTLNPGSHSIHRTGDPFDATVRLHRVDTM